MAVTRIADVIVPEIFTDYITVNSLEKTELVRSGVVSRNGVIETQLRAGADSFTVPHWLDLPDVEADIVNDDPDDLSTPHKIAAGKQTVRKSFLHCSWSAMNLASELAGSDALKRVQNRVDAYWNRQAQKRLIATLNGILADNVANDSGDMVVDVSEETGDGSLFGPVGVIDAAATLGDAMRDLSAIAMHSDVYTLALKNDLLVTERDSSGGYFQTFRGMAVIVDDSMPYDEATETYTSVLFAPGAVGYGITAPKVADGTEIESRPSAGNGGGQEILHSRVNMSIHPAGFSWTEASVAAESPTIAELAMATNWNRVFPRKAIPLAFLRHKV